MGPLGHKNPLITMTDKTLEEKKIGFWIKIGLFFIVFLTFRSTLASDFLLLDDDVNTYNNPNFKSISLNSVINIWKEPYYHLYIPITYCLWAIIYTLTKLIFGFLPPILFHLSNIIFHAANSILVFSIIKFSLHNNDDFTKKITTALFGAIIFALHPIQTEAVAWISSMKDLLYSFFALLSTRFYFTYTDIKATNKIVRHKKYLAFFFFICSVLSKPTGVTLPFIIGSYEIFLNNKTIKNAFKLLPWAIASTAFIFIAQKYMPPPNGIEYPPWYLRPVIAFDTIFFYITKILWPDALYFEYKKTIAAASSNLFLFYSCVTVIVTSLLLIKKYPIAQIILSFLFVFFISILPYSGIVPFEFQKISTVSDRYTYFSLFIFSLFVCHALNRIKLKFNTLAFCTILLASLLSVRTYNQSKIWKDDISLGMHTLKYNQKANIAYVNIGIKKVSQGLFDEALIYYQKAIDTNRTDELAYYNMGIVLALKEDRAGALKNVELLKQFKPERAAKLEMEIDNIILTNKPTLDTNNYQKFNK